MLISLEKKSSDSEKESQTTGSKAVRGLYISTGEW